MDSLPKKPITPGLVNFPGNTPDSTALAAELLHKDFVEHHCFFNDQFFHNHLAHQILSLYDLGAPPEVIQRAYDKECKILRNLHHGSANKQTNGSITEATWTTHMGEVNAHMYADHLAFFSKYIAAHGPKQALERFVFSPEANGNGTLMLPRFFGGLVHPLIHISYGLEFGADFVVAEGLAMAALTSPQGASLAETPSGIPDINIQPSSAQNGKAATPVSLLSLLREVYETPALAAPPYNPALISAAGFQAWLDSPGGRTAVGAIRTLAAKWVVNPASIDAALDECTWFAALLLGATSRPDRKPRMDFILMHFVTSALALRPLCAALGKPEHKVQLLQMWIRHALVFFLLRGCPKVNCELAMGYPAYPLPPTQGQESVAKAGNGGAGSPWLELVSNACAHSEPHVTKAIRMLFHAAQHLGNTPAGGVPGAVDPTTGKETYPGASRIDGTLFVRVAGVVTGYVGWVTHGQAEKFWDFGGLGWDESWANPDD